MKSALLLVLLATLASAAPAPWGKGCDAALLEGEFSLAKAPAFPAAKEQQAFIDRVLGEMKRGYGGTIVVTEAPHPHLDSPEFVAAYLRAFAELGEKAGDYDYRFERLLARLSATPAPLDDARLDWDLWRAWLLLENHALESYQYEGSPFKGSRVMHELDSARDLLWFYLDRNAPAILKDEKRRAWWIAQLTRDLEAPGGRPSRRWFLLLLIAAADEQRPGLQKVAPQKLPSRYSLDAGDTLREPHPLDPFLVLEKRPTPAPAFADALWQIASPLDLTLEVRGVAPETLPPTNVRVMSLIRSRYPHSLSMDQWNVIHQESWSTSGDGAEWGVRFWRPIGQRASYSNVYFPPENRDGVYFFVFRQRLYVWPKAQMDTAAVQMLETAGLIDAAALTALRERGLQPLPVTLVREK